MERRKFIKNVGLAAAGLGVSSSLYAWQIEPFWLEFVKKQMPIANLPASLQGKTLMQISDVHVGNRFDYNFIIESFKEAKRFNPDFVVYTGDYIEYESSEQYGQLDTVFSHAVKGKLATVGILGNHDYGPDYIHQDVADAVSECLERRGVTLLKNAQQEFSGLNIMGIDDFWSLNFYPERVMKQYDASKANLVLCHNPDVCDKDVWNGYQGWILSGHTHGGQCKPPFLPAPLLPVKNKRYSQGEIDLYDGRTLYINRALGHLFQVRFNVRPEITIFTLQRA